MIWKTEKARLFMPDKAINYSFGLWDESATAPCWCPCARLWMYQSCLYIFLLSRSHFKMSNFLLLKARLSTNLCTYIWTFMPEDRNSCSSKSRIDWYKFLLIAPGIKRLLNTGVSVSGYWYDKIDKNISEIVIHRNTVLKIVCFSFLQYSFL